MFRRLFSPDSDLMIVMTWITDCIFLSLFWLLGCMPVVTIGASTAALYDAVYYGFRRRDKHSWSRFWRSYVGNLRASLLPNIVFLLLLLSGGAAMVQLWNGAVADGGWMLFAVGAIIGIALLGVLSLLFPVLSRFDNRFGRLLGNTVRLALANLPRTMALGVLNAVAGWLCLRFILPVFLLPGLVALISSLFVEPILRPYLPEDFYENYSAE